MPGDLNLLGMHVRYPEFVRCAGYHIVQMIGFFPDWTAVFSRANRELPQI